MTRRREMPTFSRYLFRYPKKTSCRAQKPELRADSSKRFRAKSGGMRNPMTRPPKFVICHVSFDISFSAEARMRSELSGFSTFRSGCEIRSS
jgi:hypothetical protein